MKNELFLLDPGVYDAITESVINETVADLKELDLFRLPYSAIDVEFYTMAWTKTETEYHLDFWMRPNSEEDKQRWLIEDLGTDSPRVFFWSDIRGRYIPLRSLPGRIEITEQSMAGVMMWIMVTLFATRNAIKTRRESKLAKLGIGKVRPGKGYRYTTTISVPKVSELESVGTGTHKRPHLRRGYIRRQRFGPNLSFEKKIWIEPVFVNADPSFVSDRAAYNVAV